jgi:hypothetical protein
MLLLDVRHPEDAEKVAFICPDCCPGCKQQHFIRLDAADSAWQGRCTECRLRHRCRVIELPGGGKARRDPENSKFGWVVCPTCDEPKERYIDIPSDGSKEFENFTGGCLPCAHRRLRKLTHGQQHDSGAILLIDEPDPDNPKYRAAFICANPDQRPDCMGKSFGWLSRFHSSKWKGLCKNCVFVWRHRRKNTDNVTLYDWDDGTPIVKILLSDEDSQWQALVEFLGCGHKLSFPKRTVSTRISAHRKRRRRFGRLCRACFLNPLALIKNAQPTANYSVTQNGNGQEKGSADQTPPLSDFKRLTNEITPRIKEAQKLADVTLYEDLYRVVHSAFPDLVPEVIKILPTDKPSECAREQIARDRYGSPYGTLKRKLHQWREASKNEASGNLVSL